MSEDKQNITVRYKLEECLNCGEPLIGQNYCPTCGQENADRNLSLWTLIVDLLGDYFSFDSKLFRTSIPLLLKPGSVPLEFALGKRVRHIPPFRILIFTSFLFFMIWGLGYNPDTRRTADLAHHLEDQLEGARIKEIGPDEKIITLEDTELDLHLQGGDSIAATQSFNDLIEIKTLLDAGIPIELAVDSVASERSAISRKIYFQAAKMYASDTTTITKYFIGNLSIIIMVIQPFFALILKLLYIRRAKSFKFIRHLIFSTYFHSFILIWATIALVLGRIFENIHVVLPSIVIILVYLFIALKRFYAQGIGKTLIKTFILLLLYTGLILPTFLIISLGMSFFFF